MSPACILTVHDNLPGAVHMFDHFHVMKLYNGKLADLRRQVQRSVEDVAKCRLLNGTLAMHRQGLLNWYKFSISTGPLEGTNTKIRVLQRQAYGFGDHELFKLKIYALHESTYALVR